MLRHSINPPAHQRPALTDRPHGSPSRLRLPLPPSTWATSVQRPSALLQDCLVSPSVWYKTHSTRNTAGPTPGDAAHHRYVTLCNPKPHEVLEGALHHI